MFPSQSFLHVYLIIGKYCKFGDNFIFANYVKRHICAVKNSQLGHDLPLSGNDRVISPFRKG